MAEYMEGEVLGWVIVEWRQMSGMPELAPTGDSLYDERAFAEETAAAMTAESRAAARFDQFRVLPVINLEEGSGG